MNILIIKMSAIGDVIHTLPALNALRRHFPDARITWLVEEAASGLIDSHQAVDRVLVSRRQRWVKGLLGRFCAKNAAAIFSFMRELRDTEYDLVIDFQGLMKSAVMAGLCRGQRKIGYNKTREFSYLILNDRILPYDMDKHAIFRYLNLLTCVGIDRSEIVFKIPFGEGERLRIRWMLQEAGWTGEPVVAINPGTKWKTKLWDAAKFSRLTDMVKEDQKSFVVFTGNQADKKEITKVISNVKNRCVDFSGRTDLKELAALYEISRCVVSTDTGPMHLAAAVGTPVVALFGPTAPWRTGPFGEGHHVLRANLSCSPCFRKKCDSIACMRDISTQRVFKSVEKILERSSGIDRFYTERYSYGYEAVRKSINWQAT
jgi:3-deoxy-D-manno-octulosonic-acid transferase/heptosyltransferase-1